MDKDVYYYYYYIKNVKFIYYYTLRRNAEEYIAFTRHFSKTVNIARKEKNLHTIVFVIKV